MTSEWRNGLPWSLEEDEKLLARYRHDKRSAIAADLGRSLSAVKNRAAFLGTIKQEQKKPPRQAKPSMTANSSPKIITTKKLRHGQQTIETLPGGLRRISFRMN